MQIKYITADATIIPKVTAQVLIENDCGSVSLEKEECLQAYYAFKGILMAEGLLKSND